MRSHLVSSTPTSKAAKNQAKRSPGTTSEKSDRSLDLTRKGDRRKRIRKAIAEPQLSDFGFGRSLG